MRKLELREAKALPCDYTIHDGTKIHTQVCLLIAFSFSPSTSLSLSCVIISYSVKFVKCGVHEYVTLLSI